MRFDILPLDILDYGIVRPYLSDKEAYALFSSSHAIKMRMSKTNLFSSILTHKKSLLKDPRLSQRYSNPAANLVSGSPVNCIAFTQKDIVHLERYPEVAEKFFVYNDRLVALFRQDTSKLMNYDFIEQELKEAIPETMQAINAFTKSTRREFKKLEMLSLCGFFVEYLAKIHCIELDQVTTKNIQNIDAIHLHKQKDIIISGTIEYSEVRYGYTPQKIAQIFIICAGASVGSLGGLFAITGNAIAPTPAGYIMMGIGSLSAIGACFLPRIKQRYHEYQQHILFQQITIESPQEVNEHTPLVPERLEF